MSSTCAQTPSGTGFAAPTRQLTRALARVPACARSNAHTRCSTGFAQLTRQALRALRRLVRDRARTRDVLPAVQFGKPRSRARVLRLVRDRARTRDVLPAVQFGKPRSRARVLRLVRDRARTRKAASNVPRVVRSLLRGRARGRSGASSGGRRVRLARRAAGSFALECARDAVTTVTWRAALLHYAKVFRDE